MREYGVGLNEIGDWTDEQYNLICMGLVAYYAQQAESMRDMQQTQQAPGERGSTLRSLLIQAKLRGEIEPYPGGTHG